MGTLSACDADNAQCGAPGRCGQMRKGVTSTGECGGIPTGAGPTGRRGDVADADGAADGSAVPARERPGRVLPGEYSEYPHAAQAYVGPSFVERRRLCFGLSSAHRRIVAPVS